MKSIYCCRGHVAYTRMSPANALIVYNVQVNLFVNEGGKKLIFQELPVYLAEFLITGLGFQLIINICQFNFYFNDLTT